MQEQFKKYIRWFVRDARLRSGWRVTLYTLAFLVSLIVFYFAFAAIVGPASLMEIVERPLDFPVRFLSFYFVQTLLGLGVIWAFRKWIDRRPFLNLGFNLSHGWVGEFALGFAFVIAAWCIIFFLSLAFRTVTIIDLGRNTRDPGAILGWLMIGLILNFMVGVAEEANARGYVLQNLAEGIGIVPAIAVSSIYFALLHILNPGGGLLSTVGIFFAGVLLAMGYYLTRRLWFSIGMHAAWNFAEGPIFGFPVSGLDMSALFQLRVTGPDWLMGGPFGPEAGVLAIIAEMMMIGVLIAWTRRAKILARIEKFRTWMNADKRG